MKQHPDWVSTNEQYLSAMLIWLRLVLQQVIHKTEPEIEPQIQSWGSWFSRRKATQTTVRHDHAPKDEEVDKARKAMEALEENDPPPAMVLLSQALGLSRFDTQVLALCTAMELDTRIGELCAKAQNDRNKTHPTFALAFTLFDDPDWNVLTPQAPLRYWRLLEINQPGTQPLTTAALGADERIVNYIKGLSYLDDRLSPLLDSMDSQLNADYALPLSQQQQVDKVVAVLQASFGSQKIPVIELLGHDSASKRLVAESVSSALDVNLFSINLQSLPSNNGDFETFRRLWERESYLMPLALYLYVSNSSDSEKHLLQRFLEHNKGITFVSIEGSRGVGFERHVSIDISKPTAQEQQQLWSNALQQSNSGHSQRLAEQFSFSQHDIYSLAHTALQRCKESETALNGELWGVCRVSARAGMEKLAQRIDSKATWNQLVLPQEQTELLRQIVGQVAYRNHVYEGWGFREQMNRGLGINALFVGESGTGKTMAAEVIANELELDLYRVDLSSVVSKYIGETEKNLRKLFDAAEDSGAILFVDEADALFGKRTEVKDSHDRYANIEINYLLQRMESYRGLAILASNMRSALDKAFVRRLRFIVDFPFPAIEQRADIWKRVFPAQTPIDGTLDYQHLAKLSLTGGNIHNVAINAAFLAAQQNTQISMPLVLSAARSEYKKLERPAKESDFWWDEPEGTVA
ncbi:ATP-binding protein [Neptunomonas japonica]|uniref:AAA family ATPase n=1 Tax=Neptunomonas japonica JAMM 1380 TaxID=1441457 RepID=A0A7R6SVC4_9GAMM|nr:AAA family ATPase [Neptunomonas japonica]BBB29399.1 AAA family ATPase [Neptunomonas japonica JAMM 1380]